MNTEVSSRSPDRSSHKTRALCFCLLQPHNWHCTSQTWFCTSRLGSPPEKCIIHWCWWVPFSSSHTCTVCKQADHQKSGYAFDELHYTAAHQMLHNCHQMCMTPISNTTLLTFTCIIHIRRERFWLKNEGTQRVPQGCSRESFSNTHCSSSELHVQPEEPLPWSEQVVNLLDPLNS